MEQCQTGGEIKNSAIVALRKKKLWKFRRSQSMNPKYSFRSAEQTQLTEHDGAGELTSLERIN